MKIGYRNAAEYVADAKEFKFDLEKLEPIDLLTDYDCWLEDDELAPGEAFKKSESEWDTWEMAKRKAAQANKIRRRFDAAQEETKLRNMGLLSE